MRVRLTTDRPVAPHEAAPSSSFGGLTPSRDPRSRQHDSDYAPSSGGDTPVVQRARSKRKREPVSYVEPPDIAAVSLPGRAPPTGAAAAKREGETAVRPSPARPAASPDPFGSDAPSASSSVSSSPMLFPVPDPPVVRQPLGPPARRPGRAAKRLRTGSGREAKREEVADAGRPAPAPPPALPPPEPSIPNLWPDAARGRPPRAPDVAAPNTGMPITPSVATVLDDIGLMSTSGLPATPMPALEGSTGPSTRASSPKPEPEPVWEPPGAADAMHPVFVGGRNLHPLFRGARGGRGGRGGRGRARGVLSGPSAARHFAAAPSRAAQLGSPAEDPDEKAGDTGRTGEDPAMHTLINVSGMIAKVNTSGQTMVQLGKDSWRDAAHLTGLETNEAKRYKQKMEEEEALRMTHTIVKVTPEQLRTFVKRQDPVTLKTWVRIGGGPHAEILSTSMTPENVLQATTFAGFSSIIGETTGGTPSPAASPGHGTVTYLQSRAGYDPATPRGTPRRPSRSPQRFQPRRRHSRSPSLDLSADDLMDAAGGDYGGESEDMDFPASDSEDPNGIVGYTRSPSPFIRAVAAHRHEHGSIWQHSRAPIQGVMRLARMREGVKRIQPIHRSQWTHSKQFRGSYGFDQTPRLSLNHIGPGQYILRARRGVSRGVRQQVLHYLSRAGAHIYVNGRKHNKKQAYTVIMDLLKQNHSVEVIVNK
jgi:hypothetical protein